MCADSVPGIEHGTSMCMDTSDGAQCTVTCVDGTQGDAIFTCQQGVWMGQLTCSSPPAGILSSHDVLIAFELNNLPSLQVDNSANLKILSTFFSDLLLQPLNVRTKSRRIHTVLTNSTLAVVDLQCAPASASVCDAP